MELNPAKRLLMSLLIMKRSGNGNGKKPGSLNFLRHCRKWCFQSPISGFSTPSELAHTLQPVAQLHVPNPISWADEERDLTAWLGK